MARLLRDPLVHFLLLGVAAFAIYEAVGGPGAAEREIVIGPAELNRFVAGWRAQWNRDPTREELDGLIDAFALEEALYREALALGLDRDDTIVRRRLAQKMEFLAADSAPAPPPTDADLARFLGENADRFRVPETFTFRQVYFSPDRRGEAVAADAQAGLAQLRAGSEPRTVGDRLLLGERHAALGRDRVDRAFGAGFADGLASLETGAWGGPIESGYGLHAVRVEARTPARLPALDEVREVVVREWTAAQREERLAAFHRDLRARYPVQRETEPGAER